MSVTHLSQPVGFSNFAISFSLSTPWDSSGNRRLLSAPQNVISSTAHAINHGGQMAGGVHSRDAVGFDFQAVIWNRCAVSTRFIPGWQSSRADNITQQSVKVGTVSDPSRPMRAVVWPPDGSIQTVNLPMDVHHSQGRDIQDSGWVLGKRQGVIGTSEARSRPGTTKAPAST